MTVAGGCLLLGIYGGYVRVFVFCFAKGVSLSWFVCLSVFLLVCFLRSLCILEGSFGVGACGRKTLL